MPINKEKLISEINEVFKDVALEDGIGLSEADAIDSYSDIKFRAECRQNDEKHNWNSIPSNVLNKYNNSLSFFDAKGMRFHLQAFMIADLNGEYNFGMAFTLTHLSEYRTSQFELLSKKQREVLVLFLQHMLDDQNYDFEKPEIIRAIENFWTK